MESTNVIPLIEGLSLLDLMSENGTTFQVNLDHFKDNDRYLYNSANVHEYANLECLGFYNEETSEESSDPFEALFNKMVSIADNGKIRKRIIRQGNGPMHKLPEKSIVTIHYNAYLEYNDEPFDSTYSMKEPLTFCLGKGDVLLGLDIAVQSMHLNEKSQFLVHPDYAYGQIGCPPRVPPYSAVLYEVEVKNCVATILNMNLNENQERDFTQVYNDSHALCSEAKYLYCKGLIKSAIKQYNMAVCNLLNCSLRNYAEKEKQQMLLLKLRSNLVIAHTKVKEPHRACMHYKQINYMCQGTNLNISAKVYFNHGRCLMYLSDYTSAKNELMEAYYLEPENKEIVKELKKNDAKKQEHEKRKQALAKTIFKNSEQTLVLQTVISREFEHVIIQYCKDLIGDSDSIQYDLPAKLTKNEREFFKMKVLKHGLHFNHSIIDGEETYFIIKPSAAD